MDAQRLLNRLEIWRSLRTDSLSVALRRLPGVVARIEMEIEHARAMAGMPVDAMLIEPSKDDPAERPIPIGLPLAASIEPVNPLTLAEAYRSYIDDPTRAWTANTREAYETSRRLAIAVIGEAVPVASISRAHCRDMLDVLRFLGEDRTAKLDKLIGDFAALSTKEAEAVATLYGVWNDALSEGTLPSDDEIISGFLNDWHPEKRAKFRASELPEWLGWMRRHGIVPTGSGPKTTTGRLFV
nr:hypothetical protein [Sphingobium chlorophenolicum]